MRDQCVGIRGIRRQCDTDACAEIYGSGCQIDAAGERAAYSFCDLKSDLFSCDPGTDYEELVASETSHMVAFSDHILKACSGDLKNLVARGVTEQVVHLFEPTEIDEDNSEAAPRISLMIQSACEHLQDRGAAETGGQFVDVRPEFQLTPQRNLSSILRHFSYDALCASSSIGTGSLIHATVGSFGGAGRL
jgi:hypothetical protein